MTNNERPAVPSPASMPRRIIKEPVEAPALPGVEPPIEELAHMALGFCRAPADIVALPYPTTKLMQNVPTSFSHAEVRNTLLWDPRVHLVEGRHKQPYLEIARTPEAGTLHRHMRSAFWTAIQFAMENPLGVDGDSPVASRNDMQRDVKRFLKRSYEGDLPEPTGYLMRRYFETHVLIEPMTRGASSFRIRTDYIRDTPEEPHPELDEFLQTLGKPQMDNLNHIVNHVFERNIDRHTTSISCQRLMELVSVAYAEATTRQLSELDCEYLIVALRRHRRLSPIDDQFYEVRPGR